MQKSVLPFFGQFFNTIIRPLTKLCKKKLYFKKCRKIFAMVFVVPLFILRKSVRGTHSFTHSHCPFPFPFPLIIRTFFKFIYAHLSGPRLQSLPPSSSPKCCRQLLTFPISRSVPKGLNSSNNSTGSRRERTRMDGNGTGMNAIGLWRGDEMLTSMALFALGDSERGKMPSREGILLPLLSCGIACD